MRRFFVLAYVELFSGGANLPGGPITELVGAADVVWNPQWAVIGVYAYHCAALSLLMAFALINLDGKRIPTRLILFSLLIGIVPSAFSPSFHNLYYSPHCFQQEEASTIWTRLPGILGHLAACALGSMVFGGLLSFLDRPTPARIFNLVVALSVAVFFLGREEAYTHMNSFFPFYTVVLIVVNSPRCIGLKYYCSFLVQVWIAFLLYLVLWQRFALLLTY